MALIPCPECKTDVSDKAASCPKCGYPLKTAVTPPPVPSGEVSFWGCFWGVWLHPRKTVRKILDLRPGYFVWPALLFCSVLYSFDPSSIYGFHKRMDLPHAILVSFIVMTFVEIGRFWLDSAFIYGVGQAFGGKGSFRDFYTAFVWAYPPCFFGDLVDIPHNIPKWVMAFMDPPLRPISDDQYWWQTLLYGVYFVFWFWSIILIVINNAEAQRISMARSVVVVIIYAVAATLVIESLKKVFPDFYDLSLKKS